MCANRGEEVSVIIRVRDEATTIVSCLELLHAQQPGERALEVIVVDCGSRDGTGELAAAHGARVLELAPGRFSFGRALNLGAANAAGELLVALSGHALPPDEGWIARLLEPFGDRRVACASGDRYDPEGAILTERVVQDAALARRRPEWGYSNAAGAFRASLWRRRPFRDDLPGCEDKEWAWYWLRRGYLCVIDPSLATRHDHTHDPLTAIFRRARREAAAYGSFLELAPYGARELARDWWCDLRWYRSAARARLSPRRAARLLGAYAGRRGR
ncbi:MAG: glycosyltransferase [Solirubrobacterales bacterium]|nr:glycosyltransferase [Solirubrobacterales bacterium]